MTLGTHAITGAAVASLMPTHPVFGFCAGFASHFLADAIPHYDYRIYSDGIHPKKDALHLEIDRDFLHDAIDFSIDAGLGIFISLLVFATPLSIVTILAGAAGGILPDPLQVVAKKIPHEPLRSLQKFHQWIHTRYRLRDSGQLPLGIVSQLAFIAAVIAAAKMLP